MNKRALASLSLALGLLAAGCRGENTTKTTPEVPIGTTAEVAEGSDTENKPVYLKSDILGLPGLEQEPLVTQTSYVRYNGVPTITEVAGLNGRIEVSAHSIAELVNFALQHVGVALLTPEQQAEIGDTKLQSTEGSQKPITVRFYNVDKVGVALEKANSLATASRGIYRDELSNAIVIDVPVGAGMNDFELNATVAREIFASILSTNVTDNWVYEERDRNLTDLLVSSLAYAYAYAQTGRSYDEYLNGMEFYRNDSSGLSDHLINPVNYETYTALQGLFPIVWIPSTTTE